MPLEEEIVFLPGHVLREKILNKEFSVVEVTKIFLKRIKRLDKKLHAYTLVLEKEALEQARNIDQNLELYAKEPLLGIPISIKDLLIDLKGHATTNGSLLCKAMIAREDSLSVERLREAKSVFLGKTNASEFGSCFMTSNRLLDPTCNPWNLDCSAGGSSGGSAAAVAAGLCTIALANDSAGSIRQPSSFCSLFGFMPSFSQIPVTSSEELSLAPLNRLGPITRNVKDAAIMLNTLNPQTQLDLDQKSSVNFIKAMEKDPKELKIGFSPDLDFEIQNPKTLEILEKTLLELQSHGHKIERFKMPINVYDHLETMKHVIISKFSKLSKEVPKIARPLLGDSVNTLIEQASKLTSTELERALLFRKEFAKKMDGLFDKYDLLITPTCVEGAFKIKDFPSSFKNQGYDPFVFFAFLLYPFNMTSQPAASMPCGFNEDQMPLGLQVIAKEDKDFELFQFCAYYERLFPWHENYLNLLDL